MYTDNWHKLWRRLNHKTFMVNHSFNLAHSRYFKDIRSWYNTFVWLMKPYAPLRVERYTVFKLWRVQLNLQKPNKFENASPFNLPDCSGQSLASSWSLLWFERCPRSVASGSGKFLKTVSFVISNDDERHSTDMLIKSAMCSKKLVNLLCLIWYVRISTISILISCKKVSLVAVHDIGWF